MNRTRWLVLGGALLLGLSVVGLGLHFQQKIEREKRALLEADRRLQAEVRRLQAEASARLGDPPPPPPARALEIGPSSGARSEREAAVLDLLSGRTPALELPVLATDPGATWDPELRNRLAPIRVVSAPRSGDCNCPPGDPLCSCL